MSTQELEKEIAKRLEMLKLARERRNATVVQASPQSSLGSPVINKKDVEQERSPIPESVQAPLDSSNRQSKSPEQRNDSTVESMTRLKKTI